MEKTKTTTPAEAFEKASKLSDSAQQLLAEQLIQDIESEMSWHNAFNKSQDKLNRLAEKAAKDYQAGNVKKMGFDEL
jgi:hypothetical protein